jgi:hypothetical protein
MGHPSDEIMRRAVRLAKETEGKNQTAPEKPGRLCLA